MKKYAILGASPFTGNKGVDALLSGTLESIHYNGDSAIIVDYGKHPTKKASHFKRYSCLESFASLRFSCSPFLKNGIIRLLIKAIYHRILFPKDKQLSTLKHDKWLAPLLEVDTVASISGGDSFSDIYGFRRFLYVCLPQLLAIILGKKLIILPQTIGPFRSVYTVLIARFILNSAHCIYTRDKLSLELTQQLIHYSGPPIRLKHDMAFALIPEKPSAEPLPTLTTVPTTQPIVALNASGLMMMGGYTKNNAFGLGFEYKTLLNELSKWLISVKGCEIALIPHVTRGDENDQTACRQIFDDIEPLFPGKIHLIDHSLNEAEIKYVIGRCTFLYGSRMHACIAALSQGIPAVGLSYSRKFRGVYETIGSESLVIELSGQKSDDVLAKCRDLFENREAHKKRLIPYVKEAKSEALTLFNSLDLKTKPQRLEELHIA